MRPLSSDNCRLDLELLKVCIRPKARDPTEQNEIAPENPGAISFQRV